MSAVRNVRLKDDYSGDDRGSIYFVAISLGSVYFGAVE